jgi:hypothetical protein
LLDSIGFLIRGLFPGWLKFHCALECEAALISAKLSACCGWDKSDPRPGGVDGGRDWEEGDVGEAGREELSS